MFADGVSYCGFHSLDSGYCFKGGKNYLQVPFSFLFHLDVRMMHLTWLSAVGDSYCPVLHPSPPRKDGVLGVARMVGF